MMRTSESGHQPERNVDEIGAARKAHPLALRFTRILDVAGPHSRERS